MNNADVFEIGLLINLIFLGISLFLFFFVFTFIIHDNLEAKLSKSISYNKTKYTIICLFTPPYGWYLLLRNYSAGMVWRMKMAFNKRLNAFLEIK